MTNQYPVLIISDWNGAFEAPAIAVSSSHFLVPLFYASSKTYIIFTLVSSTNKG